MSGHGENQQLRQPHPWGPFAESVMAAPLGRSASRCVPELDWTGIMQSHVGAAIQKLLSNSYVEDVLVDGVPRDLKVDQAKSLFHPLHAVASYGGGSPVSILSNLVSPARASPSSCCGSASVAPPVAATSGPSDTAPAVLPATHGVAAVPISWSLAAASAPAAAAERAPAEAQAQARPQVQPHEQAQAQAEPQQSPEAGINAGFDCNVRDAFGRTSLHWASTAGQAAWISALIAAGADPSSPDSRNIPPLQDAIQANHASAVRSLLEGGADKNARIRGNHRGTDNYGETPLIFAAARGNPEIVRLLCDAGASLEDREAVAGFTPLLTAVAHRRLATAEVLLGNGADPNTESVRKLTPLMVAVALEDAEIVKTLLRFGTNACHAGVGDLTPLHIAAGKGNAGLIEELLRAGADPSARVANPPPRSTPLHSACRASHLIAVKALLLGGADETMGDMTPPTPAASVPGGGGAGAVGYGSGVASSPEGRETTPEDVVGIGFFGANQDPTQRGPDETLMEYERRRDPRILEAIRQALRMAPADRAWRRRSWLVMLRASAEAEAEAEAAATREKWELSTSKGSLFRMVGSGRIWGKGQAKGGGKTAAVVKEPLPKEQEGVGRHREVMAGGGSEGGSSGGAVVGSGKGEGEYCAAAAAAAAAEAWKRVKRDGIGAGDGGDDLAASVTDGRGKEKGGESGANSVAKAAAGGPRSSLPQAQQSTRACEERSQEKGSTAAVNHGGRVGEGSETVFAANEEVERDGGSGTGGDGDPADEDEIAIELRCLCGRLFDVAAVEEGAFRRIVSYL